MSIQKKGQLPEINNLQNVSLETIQYWLDRFKVDGTFYLKSLEDEVDKNSETYGWIIKTPKKGGIGLNESLEGMCVLAKALYQEKEIEKIKEKFCF